MPFVPALASNSRRCAAPVLCALSVALAWGGSAQAAVTVVIDIRTADEFSATFSGTFDEDVEGDQRDWLAFKNAWTDNYGVNTEWLLRFTGGPTSLTEVPGLEVVEDTVQIDGRPAEQSNIDGVNPFGDAVYFWTGFPIEAGMTVSGTIHLRGEGFFDPDAPLEVLTGFDDDALDWNALLLAIDAPRLAIDGACGRDGEVALTNVTPGADFALVRGTDLSGGTLPAGPCAGTAVRMESPALLYLGTADPSGEFTRRPTWPRRLCGEMVQAIDLSTCATSGVQGPL